MSLTPEQIQTIRDRLSGWEEDWGQLCVLLLGQDGESGALIRAVEGLRVKWPSEAERDDFICTVVANYNRRAGKGRLLLSYEPDAGDVVAFLTSHSILRVEALKFLRRLSARQMLSLDAMVEEAAESAEGYLAAQQDADPVASEFKKLIDRIQDELQARLEGSKRVTRIVEQAAIQMYPHLDWSCPAMESLRDHLLRAIHSPPDGTPPLAVLNRAHEAADREFQRRLDKLAAQMHNEGKGVSPKKRERIERRVSDANFERFFLPIADVPLGKLLGINRVDAAQRRSRYKRALPELLPGVGTDYLALQEDRSAKARRQPL